MSNKKQQPARQPIQLASGAGRAYEMGPMRAVFKADNEETAGTFSVSEWWLEPKTKGPGPHAHPYDHAYYILEGTVSVLIDDEWASHAKGAFILIPGGTKHDFENRGTTRAGFLSFNNEAGFEDDLPDIVEWFAKRPLERIR